MNITVVGLGKLGAVLAAVLAEAGHRVKGVDLYTPFVDAINAETSPIAETGLQELIDRLPAGALRATGYYSEAVPQSEMTMIVVPTPTGPDGAFVEDYVVSAVKEIGANLPDAWHTVVVCSTLMPGAMDRVITPALEEASGRRVGRDVGLCYSPEFIALGSVIHDMQHPDTVLIGAQDERSAHCLRAVLTSIVKSHPEVHELRFVEAELAKLAINTYVTMKISYANTIGELCERLPGASAASVLGAVGSDSRIGTRYLKAGASFGGPCFPRDNRAFATLASSVGSQAPLAIATDDVNRRVTRRIALMASQEDHVAVLGLSYKPGTPVVEESMGLEVATILATAGVDVVVHDPQARPPLPAGVRQADTIDEAIEHAGLVIVATPWPEYAQVEFHARTVVDAWNCTLPQANRRVIGEHCWWWHA